ncbi:hypothetical protein P175DRAFT_0500202 [Aspergillus ochraceoroseus IBT 24754]|uniref:Uncharacterized protein n=1 Tax=Aspergillus ochraceoroseus IBT 24754 TaxID=1392256 RepID=A0A2T5LYD3_9EURO|nr:uncharacterized protein P175DRAFT_0500202 [Aspergillus ochraceoroseus IBT 24754]PTU21300.1 hypothetical protein P175DRAFT_0500202 [Aspergillus ochraceoroseus IBT 24754]
MAPNGSLISKEELVKLSAGLRLDNTDTVYFLPSFIEEPWKGMKAVPAFPQA